MLRTCVVVSWALTACGSSEPSPVEQCDDLVDLLCDRAVQCVPGGTHATCVQAIQGELSCGSVKAVSASYDRCMDQLATHTCSVLFPPDSTGQPTLRLPADCMGVVLSRTAGGDLPLAELATANAWR